MKLALEEVAKAFGDKEVLRGCSAEFERGRIYGLLGRNGAGKTTLFKAIYGELEGFDGRILIDERPIGRDDVGMVFAEPMIPDFLTGYEFIKFYLEAHGSDAAAADGLFERMGFEEGDEHRLIKGYSSGMRSKLQIMTLLISKPPVMLLDEPLTSLDVVAAEEIKEMLLGFREGHIIIMSTHIMQLAKDMCDEIVLLKDGLLDRMEDLDKTSSEYEQKIVDALKAPSEIKRKAPEEVEFIR